MKEVFIKCDFCEAKITDKASQVSVKTSTEKFFAEDVCNKCIEKVVSLFKKKIPKKSFEEDKE